MFNFPKISKTSDFAYDSNLLKSVTFQLRFNPSDSIVKSEKLIRKSFKKEFPNIKPLMQGKISIGLEDKTPILQKTESSKSGFELKTSDGNKVLTITTDTIGLTIPGGAYLNFKESFEGVLSDILTLLKKLKINSLTRVAIRKINFVGFNIGDGESLAQSLPEIFNEPLVNNISYFPSSDFLEGGITNLSFNKDAYYLILNYGLLRKEPNVTHRQALLDIDLFKMGTKTQLSNVKKVMESINDEVFNVFNWSIQKSLLESLIKKGEKS